MPRATANKLYRTFVKGLITEASPLTYPENASINEDNCTISQKGNRTRRLGFNLESGFRTASFLPFQSATNLAQNAIVEYVWESVGNNPDVSFLCMQEGLTIYFYRLVNGDTSPQIQTFTINLLDHAHAGSAFYERFPISMVSGKGILFIAGEQIEPFYVEYKESTNSFTTNRIYVQIRDFKGVDDGLANDEEPATLSDAHRYNLLNQGWTPANYHDTGAAVTYYDEYGNINSYNPNYGSTYSPIDSYFSTTGRYPGNNKQWWVGKNLTTGAFDPALLDAFYSGSSHSPRGHFIVDAFNADRSSVSGVSSLAIEAATSRPLSVAFFSGRIFYLTHGTVYYSQILDDKRKAGFCYQEADPTSEDISDLLPSDGGVIPIPEMVRAVKLLSTGSGIIVFATNGVWYISGTSAGFSAVDLSVSKISPIGTQSPLSIVQAETEIYWWGYTGIMSMSQSMGVFGPVDGRFDKNNITLTTIQTYFNQVANLPYVKGTYNPELNVIQWMTNSTPSNTGRYFYNRVLNYDLTLKAFYPWTINTFGSKFMAGAFRHPITRVTNFITLTDAGLNNYQISFGRFDDGTYADWRLVDGVGLPFLSFVETGYELLDDAMRKKEANYIFCYFRRTEDRYVLNGTDYTLANPSSCTFQTKWDWASSALSNKWSREIEAYRFTKLPGFTESDLTFDTGFPIVVTKNKVRGNGRAIQFRFSNSTIGSNFDLLGWAVEFSGNTTP